MRARSCAFHSDSPQEFLQIAEASINSTGIFYDEKVNRHIMTSIKPKTANLYREEEESQLCECKSKRQKNPFSEFDFGLEKEEDKEEKEELERMRACSLIQVNMGIVSSHPEQIAIRLLQTLGQPPAFEQLPRQLNLVVDKRDHTIYKYWIFSRDSIDSQSQLIRVYSSFCSVMIDLDFLEQQESINHMFYETTPPLLI